MEQPVVWITNEMDRSPGELVWVDSEKWGPLNGGLLNLSYGMGQIFLVPHEKIGDQMQGGVIALPIPLFPTGVMRGRFSPVDRQLYCCGMFAWSSNQTQPGGMYRVRATGKPIYMPLSIKARQGELILDFSDPLTPESVADTQNWSLKTWDIHRTANYGSPHFNEQPLPVESARLGENGKQVTLTIPDLHPTRSMEIRYSLKSPARPHPGHAPQHDPYPYFSTSK